MKRKTVSGMLLTLLLVGILISTSTLTFAETDENRNPWIDFGRREIIVEFKSGVCVSSMSDGLTGIYSVDRLNQRYGVAGI